MLEATTTKATDQLLSQGTLGVLCVLLILAVIVLGLVIRKLYNDREACSAAQIAAAPTLATIVEKGSQTNAAVTAALDSRVGIFERLSGQITASQSQMDVANSRLIRELEEVRKSVDRLEETVDQVRRKVGA